mmetsp:Transcript_11699/g.20073  ORF Transcript_11699/g.20073 Transcript_11699/m.20073 type:complete len:404 (+) Transcript_11699:192-1403(+)
MEGSGKNIPAPAPLFPEIDSSLTKGKHNIINTSAAAPAAAFASSSDYAYEQEQKEESRVSSKRKQSIPAFAPPSAPITKPYFAEEHNVKDEQEREEEQEEEQGVGAPATKVNASDEYLYQTPVRATQPKEVEEIMADPVATTSTTFPTAEAVDGYLAKIKLPVAAKEPVTTFTDLVKWKNPYLTGLIFGTLNIIFILVLFKGYSLLRVFSSAAVFYLVTGFVVVNISRLLKGFLERDLIAPPKLPQEYIRKEVVMDKADALIKFGNHFINACVKAMYCVDSKQTLQLAGIAYGLSIVGMIIPDMVLIYLTVLVVFTFPIVYEKYQKEIDDAWVKIKKLLEQYYQMGKEEATKRSAEFQKVAAKKVEDLKTQVQERSSPYLEKSGLAEKLGMKSGSGPVEKKTQ